MGESASPLLSMEAASILDSSMPYQQLLWSTLSGIFDHVTCMWTQEWVEGGYVPIINAVHNSWGRHNFKKIEIEN